MTKEPSPPDPTNMTMTHGSEQYRRQGVPPRRLKRRLRRWQRAGHRTPLPSKPEKPTEVLTLSCPVAGCESTVMLVCPHCRQGGLVCDQQSMALICDHCYMLYRHVACENGHVLNTSYIYEKQKKLSTLLKKADGSKFLATLITFFLGMAIIWSIVRFGY